MQDMIQGRIYKFGDNVNSDIIIAGRYLIYLEPEKLAEHAFEMLGEGFPAKLRSFDILVAGRNFGCGSAREQASTAIKGLGISSWSSPPHSPARFIATPSTTRCRLSNALLCMRRSPRATRSCIDHSPRLIVSHAGNAYGFPGIPESVGKSSNWAAWRTIWKSTLAAQERCSR